MAVEVAPSSRVSRPGGRTPDEAAGLVDEASRALAMGQAARAGELVARALAVDPSHARAYLVGGAAAWARRSDGEASETLESLARAITLAEESGDAAVAADGWHALGIVYAETGCRDQALSAYRQALQRKPDHAASYASLGRESLRSGQEALAERFLRQALALEPGDRTAWRDLSLSQRRRGLLRDAVASARAAADGGGVEDQEMLAIAMTLAGDPEGLGRFAALAAGEPDAARRRWQWSEALLLHGHYRAGWREYREWLRLGGSQVDQPRGFTQPLWQGEPLAGRTILLYAEQGLGDTLQFARYVPLVAARGGRVVLEVQPPLRRLLEAVPGACTVIARSTPPDRSALPPFDVCAPLTSLPAIFDTQLDQVPEPVPMDLPGAKAIGRTARLRVGLVWAGSASHWNDRLRSIPASCLKPLAGLEGVEWVSLQLASPGTPELTFAGDCAGVTDFADTAEILAGLDLVVTVDTSVAHLAGSMGKPVWILLARVTDWRWGLTADRTPWYASARLFRQGPSGGWEAVIAQVRGTLGSVLDRQRTIRAEDG